MCRVVLSLTVRLLRVSLYFGADGGWGCERVRWTKQRAKRSAAVDKWGAVASNRRAPQEGSPVHIKNKGQPIRVNLYFGADGGTHLAYSNVHCLSTQCFAFGTRLRTFRLKNSPPDYFSLRRNPLRLQVPPNQHTEINKQTQRSAYLFGADGGTWTRTMSPSMDFESTSSANSNTSAYLICTPTRVMIVK